MRRRVQRGRGGDPKSPLQGPGCRNSKRERSGNCLGGCCSLRPWRGERRCTCRQPRMGVPAEVVRFYWTRILSFLTPADRSRPGSEKRSQRSESFIVGKSRKFSVNNTTSVFRRTFPKVSSSFMYRSSAISYFCSESWSAGMTHVPRIQNSIA